MAEENKKQEGEKKLENAGKKNKMQEIKIEKMILGVGSVGDGLEKGMKLLKLISGMKPIKTKSHKRIPTWNVRPGLEIGAIVTIRNQEKINELLRRLLDTLGNKLKNKQISDNHFSFGIHEYIEVPGLEYQREIGIIGFDVTIVFSRAGKRVVNRKIKRGRMPKKQQVKKEEIINFIKENFNVEIE